MTVIVGILCTDGVVLASDGAMAVGRANPGYTIERQDGDVLKIEIVGEDVVVAVTGAMGLGQRFINQSTHIFKTLRKPFSSPQISQYGVPQGVMDPVAHALHKCVSSSAVPIKSLNTVQLGSVISQAVIAEFEKTKSYHQVANGWGLGALVAFVHNDKPQLLEFDPVQFHPEVKGDPDSARGDRDRNWRCATMGMGSKLADAFLAHIYRVLFDGKPPSIPLARLAALWAVDHASRYTPGLVGGDSHIATLERVEGEWRARYSDTNETEEQLKAIERYLSSYGSTQVLLTKALRETVDLAEELKPTADVPASSPSTGG
jgi:hypothetical protein